MVRYDMLRVAGTCVAIGGLGVLLRGRSGSGKSDLALRLIDTGARLVTDDYTDVEAVDGTVIATAPSAIGGLLEVRGLGVVTLPRAPRVALAAVVDLVVADRVERFPGADVCQLVGVTLPFFRIAPFEASAPAKIRLAVGVASGRVTRRRG